MTRPSELTAELLAERFPRLFHMSEAGSWPSIQRHGLLSTTALLDLFGVEARDRLPIEAARRPEAVAIHHPEFGTAWIRDNKPITEKVLRRTLVGMTEAQWYRSLNSRVYFWVSEKRLGRLRQTLEYRDRKHELLVLSTEKLLSVHATDVELSPINSGAVHPAATQPRGIDTFQRIENYRWEQRLKTSRGEPVVELTVPYAVPDASSYVLDVSSL